MRNYWLDKKKEEKTTIEDFENAILAFRFAMACPNPPKEFIGYWCGPSKVEAAAKLHKCFKILIGAIIEYAKFPNLDADDMMQEGLMVCYEKMDRYDVNKSRAFNFFTTCVLGHFRQLYRATRNYTELKERYAKLLAGSKNGEEQ